MKLTMKKVNQAIQEIEAGWELVKGNGYFYWVHPTDMSYLDCATVGVYKLNDYNLDRWVEEFKGRGPDFGTWAYYNQEEA